MIPFLQDGEGKSWRLGMREGDRNIDMDPFTHSLTGIGRISGGTNYVVMEDMSNRRENPTYYARELPTNRMHRIFKVPEVQIFT